MSSNIRILDCKVESNLKMVEKIREPYQKHSRTVPSVSDISTSGSAAAEPLKRDENGEIRCVILCDSETERNCVWDFFNKSIADGESDIKDVKSLQHHWEQPYNECEKREGVDCRYCIRGPPSSRTFTSMNSDSGLMSTHTVPTIESNGFFRFRIKNTTFRKF